MTFLEVFFRYDIRENSNEGRVTVLYSHIGYGWYIILGGIPLGNYFDRVKKDDRRAYRSTKKIINYIITLYRYTRDGYII